MAKSKKIKFRVKGDVLQHGKRQTPLWRLGMQLGFTLLSLWLGVLFYRYVEVASTTTSGDLPFRPPGVEGYLPISGLMGALDWIKQGELNSVHPAATILFLIFVTMALLLRKAFCGWICPVGLLSESLARIGKQLFKRNYKLPGYLDVFLQSLKYLILGFFVWAIFSMSAEELNGFIQSPYNKVSDVKMLAFFLDMSRLGVIILLILAVLSIFVQSFWCRYLCPYGALLGLFSWMSPVRVRRVEETCIDCDKCNHACPSRLPVAQKESIRSVECIGCMDCVASCPVPDTLLYGPPRKNYTAQQVGMMILIIFFAGYVGARALGLWHSHIPDAEMRQHIERMHNPEYGHPGR